MIFKLSELLVDMLKCDKNKLKHLCTDKLRLTSLYGLLCFCFCFFFFSILKIQYTFWFLTYTCYRESYVMNLKTGKELFTEISVLKSFGLKNWFWEPLCLCVSLVSVFCSVLYSQNEWNEFNLIWQVDIC